MPGPGAAQLLEVWEEGLDQEPARRALTLLAAACPQETREELAGWPLGRRDAALLAFRTELFGPDLDAVAQCPDCGLEVELSFPALTLAAGAPAQAVTVQRDGYEVTLRAVTSDDLLNLVSADAPTALVHRCVAAATASGVPVEPAALPADLVEALGEELARTDPAATTELALECPDCSRQWLAPFHIASCLWAELHHWAGRMLLDIDALARAYGWSEHEILALAPRRRQAYLELVAP
ncbi:hypothetical protein AL755_14985 [Arthrobacter sp. ERGS1:01]|uniref:T4 family baseplate hub assembly chaperone n=1 Tax=Arthrobacter sp. ERGS1:01 TaxID=1704044 RepID=UPI0006B4E233|nr:hypothetical protein [Arthrobacter sp. ERGS1:01]ALE06460.1 hypothetical protein AL755_14985 [Arthrobacter sp. ERGS1:01]